MKNLFDKFFSKSETEVKETNLKEEYNNLLNDNGLDWETFRSSLLVKRKLNINDNRLKNLTKQVEDFADEILKRYSYLSPDSIYLPSEHPYFQKEKSYYTYEINLLGNNEINKIKNFPNEEILMKYIPNKNKENDSSNENKNYILTNLKNIEIEKLATKQLIDRLDEYAYFLTNLDIKLKEKFEVSEYKGNEKYEAIQSNVLSSIKEKESEINEGVTSSIHLFLILQVLTKTNKEMYSKISNDKDLPSTKSKLKR